MKIKIRDHMDTKMLNKIQDYVVNLNLDADSVMSIMAKEFYHFDDATLLEAKKFVMYLIWLHDNNKSLKDAFDNFVERLELLERQKEREHARAQRGRPDFEKQRLQIEERRREQQRIDRYATLARQQREREEAKKLENDANNLTDIEITRSEEKDETFVVQADKTVEYIKLLAEEVDYEKTLDFSARKEIFDQALKNVDNTQSIINETRLETIIDEITINNDYGVDDDENHLTLDEVLNSTFGEDLDQTLDNSTHSLDAELVFNQHEDTRTMGIDDLDLESINFEEVEDLKTFISKNYTNSTISSTDYVLSNNENLSRVTPAEIAKTINDIFKDENHVDEKTLTNYLDQDYDSEEELTRTIIEALDDEEILNTLIADNDDTLIKFEDITEANTQEAIEFLANFENKYGTIPLEDNTILEDEIEEETMGIFNSLYKEK
ncbi:hypothetical protein CXP39_02010 [Mesoplasma syrphidae]|uniref:Uncharacterized protein n=1 Tax=Mesoplasma syrphidae TaxID=225999 RepID=A0A2K9BJX5_9MOLU|nr:hypothetical protein [Mesoplasma syrphidae]AUF83566.1 hypothetical protein CXP39_02010 [Mesoplasma syrphidae]